MSLRPESLNLREGIKLTRASLPTVLCSTSRQMRAWTATQPQTVLLAHRSTFSHVSNTTLYSLRSARTTLTTIYRLFRGTISSPEPRRRERRGRWPGRFGIDWTANVTLTKAPCERQHHDLKYFHLYCSNLAVCRSGRHLAQSYLMHAWTGSHRVYVVCKRFVVYHFATRSKFTTSSTLLIF